MPRSRSIPVDPQCTATFTLFRSIYSHALPGVPVPIASSLPSQRFDLGRSACSLGARGSSLDRCAQHFARPRRDRARSTRKPSVAPAEPRPSTCTDMVERRHPCLSRPHALAPYAPPHTRTRHSLETLRHAHQPPVGGAESGPPAHASADSPPPRTTLDSHAARFRSPAPRRRPVADPSQAAAPDQNCLRRWLPYCHSALTTRNSDVSSTQVPSVPTPYNSADVTNTQTAA